MDEECRVRAGEQAVPEPAEGDQICSVADDDHGGDNPGDAAADEAKTPPRSILELPDIPEFLKLTAEQRAVAWVGHRYTDARTGLHEDEVATRQRARQAALDEETARKKAKGLKAFKDKHKGERWDKKSKRWVPIATAAVKPAEPAERPTPSALGKWLEG